ncbi:hypothetical protein EN814_25190 [Mesorhizobium sp. M2D.F.Ca.ET.171.01.1.1]|nr:hypothetical protein EN868_27400 [Mesorhizobium sp. M2D.F.Ca.ET.225.01.1.1]TGP73104.1 hypothetical protein EN867_23075 [Mesorhizobium sp. M2D.F.Ca.ET.224.01.1.1]TGP85744.1 hypothetical protein EN864_25635 [bacterium M00.F.Ca.ET.221.01.1.1]TGP90971.1 hypothetical protein EN865_23080 [bacterium M00.F.Ca.ET.222.01.1.1]TGQ83063.1 hypothetical protein EN849_27190 [Mesorhizobium sp. M2D.F.Ca.ET.206.01.1.1]TGS92380.1 hypothetical protein EN821_25200 [Mesorhizobium sp. M2D.F.Ca.ET.178.01.1.1]TGT08
MYIRLSTALALLPGCAPTNVKFVPAAGVVDGTVLVPFQTLLELLVSSHESTAFAAVNVFVAADVLKKASVPPAPSLFKFTRVPAA